MFVMFVNAFKQEYYFFRVYRFIYAGENMLTYGFLELRVKRMFGKPDNLYHWIQSFQVPEKSFVNRQRVQIYDNYPTAAFLKELFQAI